MNSTERVIEMLEHRGIREPLILDAVHAINREFFLEGAERDPSPEVLGRMLQAMKLDEGGRLLQIGTGSGYAAAILSRIADEVFTTENDPDTAYAAQVRLEDIAIDNVKILYGHSLSDYTKHAPYDGILIMVGMNELPRRLGQRLAIGGTLVAAVGKPGGQALVRMTRTGEDSYDEEVLGSLKERLLLGDILVEMGVIERAELELAALEADATGRRLGETLMEANQVDQTDIYRALAVQRAIDLITAEEALNRIDVRLARSLPRHFLEQYNLLPVGRDESSLIIATADLDISASQLAERLNVQRVELMLITPTDLKIVWNSIDRLDVPGGTSMRRGMSMFDGGNITKLDDVLLEAAKKNATAVHIERREDKVVIRFRIDSELIVQPIHITSKGLDSISHIVKIRSHMDPKVRRRPQRGEFDRRVEGHTLHIKACTLPSKIGESIVLKLTRQLDHAPELDELLVTDPFKEAFRKILERPSGILIMAGSAEPTRAPLLLTGLVETARVESKKTVALIERLLPLPAAVDQIKVSEKLEYHDALDLAMALDADVIYAGPLQGEDHAEALLHASRQGSLVIVSTDDQDAVTALHYFQTLGLNPGLVSTQVIGVISHRELSLDDDVYTLASMLEIDGAMRRALALEADLDTLRITALASGFKSLEYQAALLAGDAPLEPQAIASHYPQPWRAGSYEDLSPEQIAQLEATASMWPWVSLAFGAGFVLALQLGNPDFAPPPR